MYIERKIEPPCKDCITLPMCRHRAHEKKRLLDTQDIPVVIVRSLMPICQPLTDFIHSHPHHYCEYETSYMTQVINIMKLGEKDDNKTPLSMQHLYSQSIMQPK